MRKIDAMPYIKKKTEFEKVSRLIRGYATAPKVAEMIGCSAPTARKKLNNPQEFTLGEIRTICLRAHIPVEDMRGAMTI